MILSTRQRAVMRGSLGGATALLVVGLLPAQHASATTAGPAIAWGNNHAGQLGNDSRTERDVPVQVSGLTSGVSAVSAGSGHSVALKSGGSVVAWGDNAFTELGDGTNVNSSVPVAVSGLSSGVTALAAGYYHNLALKADGSVVAWGYNGSGQIGDGGPFGSDVTTEVPTQVVGLTSGVTAVAAGEWHSLALKSDGSVVAWGMNAWGQLGDGTTADRHTPVPVTGLTSGVVAIAAGGAMSLALKSNGAVVAWGDNSFGELGDGTTTNRSVPVQVKTLTSGVAAIAAGRLHSLALKSDGSVLGWGDNQWGQVGDNTTTNRRYPTPVSGLSSGIAAIAAGSTHSLALRTDGAVLAWGHNNSGQLGDDTTVNRYVPVQVTGQTSGNMAIAGGGEHSLAVTTTALPGDPPQPTVSVADAAVDEGTTATPNKATTLLKFKVKLSATTIFPVDVTVATHPGTAQFTPPSDFVFKTQTLHIPAGHRTAVFKVKLYPDSTVEPNETLTVTLSYPNNADIGDGEAIGTIRNDD